MTSAGVRRMLITDKVLIQTVLLDSLENQEPEKLVINVNPSETELFLYHCGSLMKSLRSKVISVCHHVCP